MNFSNVRAVLCDLDGTLYHQTPLRLLMALELCTLPVKLRSITKARAVLRAIKRFRVRREELRGLGRQSELLDELQYRQAAVDVGVEATEMERIICEWMYLRPLKYLKWCRRKGVVEFFSEAQHNGMPLGVFSDYPAHEKLKALGLDSYVSLVLCATDKDINAFKPHPGGFLRACEQWGMNPNEVLYVGDRLDVDAKGASSAGMRCLIVGSDGRESQFANSDQTVNLGSFQGLQQLLPT